MINLYRKSETNFKDRHYEHKRERFQQQIKNEPRYSTGSFATGEIIKKSCFYCSKNHWSDECKEYADIKSRKKKASGCCFICLKKGHLLKKCQSTRPCVYCKKSGNHHRSLCPKQFSSVTELSNSSIKEREEPAFVVIDEQVIIQTAHVDLVNLQEDDSKQKTRLLLDSGSQRSYISREYKQDEP